MRISDWSSDVCSSDLLVLLLATLDAEVLGEQGAVQAFDKAVGLRALDAGGTVLDLLELEEQLVGMAAVRPAAELAAVVAQDRGDLGLVLLKGRQHVGVEIGRAHV